MQAYGDLDDGPLVDAVVDDSIASPVHLGAGFLHIDAQIQFVHFDLYVEPVFFELFGCFVHHLLGKTVQADHRSDVQVIVPFDEGFVPHRA